MLYLQKKEIWQILELLNLYGFTGLPFLKMAIAVIIRNAIAMLSFLKMPNVIFKNAIVIFES